MSKVYEDDDLLPIRYLNDIIFCERRAALHLNEQVWVHNQYTVEGIHSHQRVDRARESKRAGSPIAFTVWLVSRRLGLVGVSDVVEFHTPEGPTVSASRSPQTSPELREASGGSVLPRPVVGVEASACPPQPEGCTPADTPNRPRDILTSNASESIRGLIPYPVEFKRGRRRRWDRDDVQLCAQAVCLEEMLGVTVPRGAIFHVKSRQRREVVFDSELRQKTENTVGRLRDLADSGVTPLPTYEKKCDSCSLKEICLPKAIRPRATAGQYLARVIAGEFESSEDANETE